MTEIKLANGKEIALVEVPKKSVNHLFDYWEDLKCGSIYYDIEGDQYGGETLMGNYTFLCTTDTITEEIAKGIVDKIGAFYVDYISMIPDLEDALFSFCTLIMSESHNLSPEKTYAILQKEVK